MDGDVFDTYLFMDEVEKRPAIWDMASTEYSNKASKRRAWEETMLIFSDSGDRDDLQYLLRLDEPNIPDIFFYDAAFFGTKPINTQLLPQHECNAFRVETAAMCTVTVISTRSKRASNALHLNLALILQKKRCNKNSLKICKEVKQNSSSKKKKIILKLLFVEKPA
jgi:hypothetical protein